MRDRERERERERRRERGECLCMHVSPVTSTQLYTIHGCSHIPPPVHSNTPPSPLQVHVYKDGRRVQINRDGSGFLFTTNGDRIPLPEGPRKKQKQQEQGGRDRRLVGTVRTISSNPPPTPQHTHMYACVCTHTHTNIRTHANTCANIHTHAHTHPHTCTCTAHTWVLCA